MSTLQAVDENSKFRFPFEDLEVWKLALDFVQEIYKVTANFPDSEKYGLRDQLRRAAISISLNIAEGKGRYYSKEFVKFLYIARGSLYECVTCSKLATRLNYLEEEKVKKLLLDTYRLQRKLSGLINSMK